MKGIFVVALIICCFSMIDTSAKAKTTHNIASDHAGIRQPVARPHRRRYSKRRNALLMIYRNAVAAGCGLSIATTNNIGVYAHLSFEHYFGKKNMIAARITATTVASTDNWSLGGGASYGDVNTNTTLYYLSPAIIIHPFGNEKKFDYGVGLGGSFGQANARTASYLYSGFTVKNSTYSIAALTLENDVNFNTRSPFLFGLHTAVGPLFYAQSTKFLFQIGIKIGGCF